MNQQDGHVTGFVQGNAERWSYIISSYLPQAWTIITKTVDPLVYAALIELLGNNQRFKKVGAVIVPAFDEEKCIISLSATLSYTIPDFAGFQGAQEAVTADQTYILKKIQQAGNIQFGANSVVINTKTGALTVAFRVPVGQK
jgi:hypothetical protein